MKLLRNLYLIKLFLQDFKINKVELNKTFKEEYKSYLKIKRWFSGKKISKDNLIIYSPGCGRDFATMLMIYDAIASEKNTRATFVFQDIRDFYDGIIYELEKYTLGKKLKIIQHKAKDKYSATAYFKNKTFNIIYYVKDASNFFPPELNNNIDIYYERAFEMFRSKDAMMLYKILKNVKPLGLLISDYGFEFGSQKQNFKKLSRLPKNFGLYGNFQIWQKKLNKSL
ncbi:MAG: hypothetical protein ACMXX5_01895 [Candidatus Woesearchaeota archaeon]